MWKRLGQSLAQILGEACWGNTRGITLSVGALLGLACVIVRL